jgi:hypothetical protein
LFISSFGILLAFSVNYFFHQKDKNDNIKYIGLPEICINMESSLIDPEEVQHCLRGSQDHQVIQPVKNDSSYI